ncbi:MAG: hypothetical protein AAF802_22430 [Planctomycetota bacterium]
MNPEHACDLEEVTYRLSLSDFGEVADYFDLAEVVISRFFDFGDGV